MRITQPAPFIWAAPPFARRNVWQMFRREFTLDFPPETASLHITADTRYTLFVNGVRLGSGPMKYFQAHIPYDTYDIAPYSAGEQTFFIPYDLVKPYLNDYGLHLLELDT